jgi:hypothetical protein
MSLTKVTNPMLNLTDTSGEVSNTAVGYTALVSNGTGPNVGFNNTALGYAALTALDGSGVNTNPTGNTAVGYLAAANCQGATNTVVGDSAHQLAVDGDDNTIVGAQANYSNLSGTGNCIFGFQAGYNNLANYNNAFGNFAMYSTTTGTSNVAMGASALYSNQTGSSNTAIGAGALNNVTQGGNVALGYLAGRYANSANEFYINNRDLTNNATEQTNSLVYGGFNITPNNQFYRINGRIVSGQNIPLNIKGSAPTIASATTIAPSVAIVFVSGTAAIDTITVPSWMEGGAQITLIPTGIFTTTTSGNIALASTAVVSKSLTMTYDSVTTKWYPSY